MLGYVRQAEEEGLPLTGLWIQDWSGHINTSFGYRVFWNWEWDPKQYPGQLAKIHFALVN